MADEMKTKPTTETVLERISALDKRFDERIGALEKTMNERFDSVDNEIDRVASVAHSTKAEMLTLRADFRELRAQLKEVIPIPQAS
jgi:chromosome segregation ATPase